MFLLYFCWGHAESQTLHVTIIIEFTFTILWKNKHYLRSLLCVCWLATCRWVALANNFRSTSDWIEHSVNNRIKPYRNVCVWFLVTVTLKGYTNLIFQSDDVLICPISNPFRNVSSPQSGPVWWLTWCFMTRDGDSIGLQACKDDMCP